MLQLSETPEASLHVSFFCRAPLRQNPEETPLILSGLCPQGSFLMLPSVQMEESGTPWRRCVCLFIDKQYGNIWWLLMAS